MNEKKNNKELKKMRKQKTNKRRNSNGPRVLEFNLSKSILVLLLIGMIIGIITTARIITTINEGKQNNALATEDGKNSERVNWVTSSDGIEVPVPKGYVASQIPGETSVNGGFVIYEDTAEGIDWDTILGTGTSTTSLDEETNITETTNNNEETNKNEEAKNDENANKIEELNQNEEIKTEDKTKTEEKKVETENKTTNLETESTTEPIAEKKEEEINTEEATNTTTEKTSNENLKTDEVETEKTIEKENTEQKKEETKTESTEDIKANEEVKTTEEETTSNEVLANTEAEKTNIEETTGIEARVVVIPEEPPVNVNVFNLQKSTNQYVWVPVNDISRIYGVDSNGKLWGKSYDFFGNLVVRVKPYENSWTETSETNKIMSLTDKTVCREPDVITTYYEERKGNNIDSKLQEYLYGETQYKLLSQELEKNFYKTIESIKKYGGFYIGRYETGGLHGTTAVIKMHIDIEYQTWYEMYKRCKELKGENDNVVTSMIWGSLWDETLLWLLESEAQTSDGEILTAMQVGYDSTTWGNYKNGTFSYIPFKSDTGEATETKAINKSISIPTGSSEYTKVNNIYDLAGNVQEFTLEAYSNEYRVQRGGCLFVTGTQYPADYRYCFGMGNYKESGTGCRAILCIK